MEWIGKEGLLHSSILKQERMGEEWMGGEGRGRDRTGRDRSGRDWKGRGFVLIHTETGGDGTGTEGKGWDWTGKEWKGFIFTSTSEDTMAVQRYPLDFDALEKGDVISAEQVEAIVEIKRDDIKYGFAAMALGKRIKKELQDRDKEVTVRMHQSALMICDDADASPYNERMIKARARGVGRFLRQLSAVDRSKLPEERVPLHDRALTVWTLTYQAMRSTRRKLLCRPKTRSTPKLTDDESGAGVTV